MLAIHDMTEDDALDVDTITSVSAAMLFLKRHSHTVKLHEHKGMEAIGVWDTDECPQAWQIIAPIEDGGVHTAPIMEFLGY